jgi:hypothetical protein
LELHINEEIVIGPGLTRVISAVLEDPLKLSAAK